MGKITTRKRNKKSQSKFQKLWDRAENLKEEIARRDSEIELLAKRVESEVYPAEREAIKSRIPLLYRLLDLGRRKSWSNWQRQELELWIAENIHLSASFSLIDDELKEAIARYDAFRLGVELDDNDGAPLGEQLSSAIEQREEAEQQEREAMQAEASEDIEQMVENTLDKTLGQRPESPNENDETTPAQAAYDKERAELQEELRKKYKELLAHLFNEDEDEDEDDEYGFGDFDGDGFDWQDYPDDDPEDGHPEAAPRGPLLDNSTMQRMFRSTAAVLHPDREKDPEKRLEKQTLMVELLAARKSGDVMAVLRLYQEHVGDGQALSKDDEKTLLVALEKQVDELRDQLENYESTSMFHSIAWDFYAPSKSAVNRNINEYLEQLSERSNLVSEETKHLRSMASLKPLLQVRYEKRLEESRYSGYY